MPSNTTNTPNRSLVGGVDAAAGNNPHLKAFLNNLVSSHITVLDKLGIQVDSGGQAAAPSLPPPANMTVSGLDGIFIITITNPQNIVYPTPGSQRRSQGIDTNQLGRTIYHQIQGSLDPLFNSPTTLITLGPSSSLSYQVKDHPNENRFWRLRSSYDQQNFNQWKALTT